MSFKNDFSKFSKPACLMVSASALLAGALLAVACGQDNGSTSRTQDFTAGQLDGSGMPSGTFALTFDDGLGARSVELGRYLKNEGIETAFFLNGVNGRTGDMATLQGMNHLIANHTHNHLDMQSGSTNKVNQVVATDNLIKPYITGGMYMFRAPFGSWNGSVANFLNANGLKKYVGSIFWDVGGELTSRYSADWDCWGRGLSVSNCGDGYLNEMADQGRGIVLMHDIHSKTVDMVKYIVPKMKARGYKFVRLDAVPSVRTQLLKAGAAPGTRFGGGAPRVGVIECPAGYTLTKVGTEGGQICLNGVDAYGPFTAAMVARCESFGGGPACKSDRWAQNMALNLRGTGVCPVGAALDSLTTYCVEGANAFGPFPKALVAKCVTAGGGSACSSARWNRNFLANLL